MTADYLARRLIRLYPMHLIGLLLGTIGVILAQSGAFTDLPLEKLAICTTLNFLYLPCLNDYTIGYPDFTKVETSLLFPANGPAWSLFFELVMSIAFLGLCRLSRGALAITVILFLAAFTLAGIHFGSLQAPLFEIGYDSPTFLGGFPRAAYSFGLGMLLYHGNTAARNFLHMKWRGWKIPFGPSIVYFLLAAILIFPFRVKGLYPVMFLLALAPAVLFFGSLVTCRNRLSLDVTRFLGWISYPLYCLHIPILRACLLLAFYFHWPYRGVTVIAASTITIIASCLVARFYDEPVRAWLTEGWRRQTIGRTSREMIQKTD